MDSGQHVSHSGAAGAVGLGSAGAGGAAPVEKFTWVACDACEKWRKLPATVDEHELPENWTCADNIWDPAHASCDAEEEQWADAAPAADDGGAMFAVSSGAAPAPAPAASPARGASSASAARKSTGGSASASGMLPERPSIDEFETVAPGDAAGAPVLKRIRVKAVGLDTVTPGPGALSYHTQQAAAEGGFLHRNVSAPPASWKFDFDGFYSVLKARSDAASATRAAAAAAAAAAGGSGVKLKLKTSATPAAAPKTAEKKEKKEREPKDKSEKKSSKKDTSVAAASTSSGAAGAGAGVDPKLNLPLPQRGAGGKFLPKDYVPGQDHPSLHARPLRPSGPPERRPGIGIVRGPICVCQRPDPYQQHLMLPCADGGGGCNGWVHPQCVAAYRIYWEHVFTGGAAYDPDAINDEAERQARLAGISTGAGGIGAAAVDGAVAMDIDSGVPKLAVSASSSATAAPGAASAAAAGGGDDADDDAEGNDPALSNRPIKAPNQHKPYICPLCVRSAVTQKREALKAPALPVPLVVPLYKMDQILAKRKKQESESVAGDDEDGTGDGSGAGGSEHHHHHHHDPNHPHVPHVAGHSHLMSAEGLTAGDIAEATEIAKNTGSDAAPLGGAGAGSSSSPAAEGGTSSSSRKISANMSVAAQKYAGVADKVRELEFLVKWKGMSYLHCTWETEESLINIEQAFAYSDQTDFVTGQGTGGRPEVLASRVQSRIRRFLERHSKDKREKLMAAMFGAGRGDGDDAGYGGGDADGSARRAALKKVRGAGRNGMRVTVGSRSCPHSFRMA